MRRGAHPAAHATIGAAFAVLLLPLVLPLRSPNAGPPGPEEDYALHCSGCHQLDGAGISGVVPTLHGLGPLLERPGGRAYLARVPGVAQAPLSDARAARLLNWALARFAGTSPQPAYSADEIRPLRRSPLRDPGAARAALTRRDREGSAR